MKKSALVTGASGAIGPLLVEGLVRAGYQVKVLVRTPPETPVFDDSVSVIPGDITEEERVKEAVAGVHHVFHLAARLHVNHPDPEREASYFHINTFGTKVIADACVAAGVERLIFFSTISVYGENRGKETLTELSPVYPASFYAKSKKAAEDIVLGARKKDDHQTPIGVVLRVSAVYGSRMKGNYQTLFSAIKKGWFFPVGKGKNRRTLIFETDLVQAAILAATHPLTPGEIFNVTDGDLHSIDDILKAMYRALGKRKPEISLPEKPVRFFSRVADAVFALSGNPGRPVTQMIEKFLEDVAVSGERFQKETGFRAGHTLDQGFLETVRRWNDAPPDGKDACQRPRQNRH